jgi:orotidine-5'-phosphate decarboxylase
MSPFVEKLLQASRSRQSLLCVGLDPDPALLPPSVLHGRALPEAIIAFNRAVIEATADLVCAYKPNLAFYEALGRQAFAVFAETLAAIPRDIVTIADAKRGDIGNTARLYAQALYETFGCDAVTVNPYLGYDALEPFLAYSDRGVFVLCRTSNPGAADLQDLPVLPEGEPPRPLYQHIAALINRWNTHGNCGLVVGATYPSELRRVREICPNLPILIPGVGAQGGDLEAAVRAGVDANGELAVVNVARSVLYASRGDDFAPAARAAAQALRDAINAARHRTASG